MSAFPEAVVDLIWMRAEDCCERCGRGLIRGSDSIPYSIQHRRARGSGGCKLWVIRSAANGGLVCGSATTPGMCHEALESNREREKNEREGWVISKLSNIDPARVPLLLWGDRTVFLTSDGRYDVVPEGIAS